mmetsp:Transcript_12905/g.24164  ORF Transcript_12905/g.24164 Transcript_12905/m.24164 type:complete len:173 (-) Transcript_12905:2589-3107(-)
MLEEALTKASSLGQRKQVLNLLGLDLRVCQGKVLNPAQREQVLDLLGLGQAPSHAHQNQVLDPFGLALALIAPALRSTQNIHQGHQVIHHIPLKVTLKNERGLPVAFKTQGLTLCQDNQVSGHLTAQLLRARLQGVGRILQLGVNLKLKVTLTPALRIVFRIFFLLGEAFPY